MPTPIFLLDTNVALALLRGKELGQYLLSAFSLDNQINRPLISIVSHGELLVLADRNEWGHQKLEAMHKMLDNLVAVDLNDDAVLDAYAAVQRDSRKVEGGSRELNANDAWIIACARAADATLLTMDRDFVHLKSPSWKVQFIDPKPYLTTFGQ